MQSKVKWYARPVNVALGNARGPAVKDLSRTGGTMTDFVRWLAGNGVRGVTYTITIGQNGRTSECGTITVPATGAAGL